MNWKTITCILFLWTGFVSLGHGQEKKDFSRLMKLYPVESEQELIQTKADWSNEVMLIMSVGFNVYKKYISSQDAMNCSFYPSCSSYALQTIQNNGFLGIFDAIDRLTRCNGFSPEKYHTHPETHRYYDPVRKTH